jgi:hypothetical protein
MDLREIDWGVWSGFSWLRIGTVGGLLWMRWWTFGFWRHGVSYHNRRQWQCLYSSREPWLPFPVP